MGKKRDYKAEYARRDFLAKARGFDTYAAQRRAIEKGEVPALAPSRIRSKRTADAQQVWASRPRSLWELAQTAEGRKEINIDRAIRWSRMNARSDVLRFDPERAKTDDRYLTVYINAFVAPTEGHPELAHHFEGTDWQEEYFVEIMEYYEAEEFDEKYGED